MYAKILNNAVVKYPYQWTDFEQDNNNTEYGYPQPDILILFPQTDIAKEGYTVVAVASVTQPTINVATQFIAEAEPILVNGVWSQNWVVTQFSAEQIAQKMSEKSSNVRNERNAKLAECDWTQVADSTADKTAWVAYRQELRDVPAQTGFPWDVTWPTAPQ
jgi:hypothetical protein